MSHVAHQCAVREPHARAAVAAAGLVRAVGGSAVRVDAPLQGTTAAMLAAEAGTVSRSSAVIGRCDRRRATRRGRAGKIGALEALIAFGADINIQNDVASTALMRSALKGHTEACRVRPVARFALLVAGVRRCRGSRLSGGEASMRRTRLAGSATVGAPAHAVATQRTQHAPRTRHASGVGWRGMAAAAAAAAAVAVAVGWYGLGAGERASESAETVAASGCAASHGQRRARERQRPLRQVVPSVPRWAYK